MTEKHAATAAGLLVREGPAHTNELARVTPYEIALSAAHVEATLALAEQARIANLIALHDLRFRGYLQGALDLPPLTQSKLSSTTGVDELHFKIQEALDA